MGSGQSVRATHFSRVSPPDEPEEHRISISNKMVERLVDDATLAGGAAPAKPVSHNFHSDYKEKIYTEKIKSLDESHSEKSKITKDDLNTLVRRIDLRSSNMVTVEAVCPDFQERVIECYKESEDGGDVLQCWGAINEFSHCVEAAGAARLNARTRADAVENARRGRRVALAREHALRDLAAP